MNDHGILPVRMRPVAFCILLIPGLMTAATYEQDFDSYPDGTTDLGDGTLIVGSSASVQDGRLQLTRDRGTSGFASFSIPAMESSSSGFTASFDIELYDSVNFNPPADGFSFNYGNAPMGDRGAAEEGMRTRPVTENLSFEVDTWRNGDSEQGVNISGLSNGLDVGQLAFTNGIILNDGQRVSGTVEIEWNPESGASFRTTGLQTNADFTDVDTRAFTGDNLHTFIISARVGGANQDLFVDNLRINTGAPGDRDNDGLSDSYELANGLDPDDDGSIGESSPGARDGPHGSEGDPDEDGLTNSQERDLRTNPRSEDTDGDGLIDSVEDNSGTFISITRTGTSPVNPDTDGDGIPDAVENPDLPFIDSNQPGTDPNNPDTDGDSVGDNVEIASGRNPTVYTSPPTSYYQDFDSYPNGTTDLGDGTVIAGSAASVEGGQLRLTIDGQRLDRSSFSIPALGGSSRGWTATFDVTIADGPLQNVPADGFSLNYGNAPLGILGSGEEGMEHEDGVTENLSFEVDTWRNFDTEQGLGISGKAAGEDMGNLSFVNGPILRDGATASGTVSVIWDPGDGATFITSGLDTNADFINVGTGAFSPDDSHSFVISARVGDATETLLIDNIVISSASSTEKQLKIRSLGSDLQVSFESQSGKIYDILVSEDPSKERNPAQWRAWQRNIASTPPINIETFRRPAEQRLFLVVMERDAPPYFLEDFESGQAGWTAGSHNPDDQTSWELGTPRASTGPAIGADGSTRAFSTNLGNYGDNANIFLRSPVIDLSDRNLNRATLMMDHFRDADGLGDQFGIRVLRAGDRSVLARIDPDPSIFDTDWAPLSEDLPAAALGEQIILEFWFTSDASGDSFSGWSIDNVAIDAR